MLQSELSTAGKLIIALVALTCTVVLIALSHTNNAIISLFLGAASVAVLVRSRGKPADIVPFIVGAILGPTMEIILIHFGVWSYSNPTFAGIPLWLPFLWGLTIFMLTKLSVILQTAGQTRPRSQK